jgi:GNAT superfamily N-acetyltransferase
MFWVRKDYRRTPLARDLIKTMEAWAKTKDAHKIIMAAGSGYQTERVERFYNRLGYKTTALTTCKEI